MTESSVPSPARWEYRFMVKQTDRQMLLELNQIGHEGWEAITMSYDKDLKGVMNWTCWLKRPCAARVEPAPPPAASPTAAPTAEPTTTDAPQSAGAPPAGGFDLSDGDFGLKD